MTFQERNGTRGMKPEHSGWNLAKKIRKGPRFKIRWKLFCFILFFELVWNVSAIPDETEQNWQSWFVVVDKFFFSKSIFFLILIFYFAYWIYGIFNISRWLSNKKKTYKYTGIGLTKSGRKMFTLLDFCFDWYNNTSEVLVLS